jgi:DNA-binding PadR family transcriptional regulator
MFERGDLKYVVLELVSERPRHGYEVIRALEERFNGFYSPSPGAVYPTLQMLEDMGYVTSSEQDGKKVYSITEEGRSHLAQRQPQVDEIWGRMRERWESDLGRDVHRLMHELRDLGGSLRDEARRRWPDPNRVRRIREVISKAKADIEAILAEEGTPGASAS